MKRRNKKPLLRRLILDKVFVSTEHFPQPSVIIVESAVKDDSGCHKLYSSALDGRFNKNSDIHIIVGINIKKFL